MEVGLGNWSWAEWKHHFGDGRKGGKSATASEFRGREDEI